MRGTSGVRDRRGSEGRDGRRDGVKDTALSGCAGDSGRAGAEGSDLNCYRPDGLFPGIGTNPRLQQARGWSTFLAEEWRMEMARDGRPPVRPRLGLWDAVSIIVGIVIG